MFFGGKFFGAIIGLLMAGIVGLLAGLLIGHFVDMFTRFRYTGRFSSDGTPFRFSFSSREEVQEAFFEATFSTMGHVAKSDGRVSNQEIDFAEELMRSLNLSEEAKVQAREHFRAGKSANFDIAVVLQRLHHYAGRMSPLVLVFMELQIQVALADGAISVEERRILLEVARHLSISEKMFDHIEQQVRMRSGGEYQQSHQTSVDNAYGTLEIKKGASMAEIKRAYRRLMSLNHPDKLVSKGLPEEMIKVANEKTQNIRKAYEILKSQHEHAA